MTSDRKYKVGDKLISGGYVYKIFKLDDGGETIFFKPLFSENKANAVVRKIPRINIDKTNMREPISSKEASEVLRMLKEVPKRHKIVDLNEAKDMLIENDCYKTVEVVKWLWMDRNPEDGSFTFSKKRVFELATERLQEEIAYANDISLEAAEKKILQSLKSLQSN